MKLSAILATLNRHELLRGCLESLQAQTCRDFEIIVIDQSDNTLTRELCERPEFAELPILYYHVDFRGLSRARNYGIARATGDYLWLVDDDAVYEPDYAANAAAFLEDHPGSALCGMIFDYDQRSHNSLDYSSLEAGQKMTVNDLFRVAPSPALLMPRNPVTQAGGFDERFGVGAVYGSGEETDVLLRLMKQGVEVYFLSGLKLYHGSGEQVMTPEAAAKVYAYYMGNGALMKKHLVNRKDFSVAPKFLRLTVGAYIRWLLGDQQQKELYRKRIQGFHRGFREFQE